MLFDKIIVSCPNDGGLFAFCRNQPYQIDNFDTTGIYTGHNKIIRGLQPDSIVIYESETPYAQCIEHKVHDIHDVLFHNGYLYLVGTTGNEIIQLDEKCQEKNRWQFQNEKDAIHINCLASWGDEVYFCAFGDFTQHREYKGKTRGSGYVQRLFDGERPINGLSQPHSLVEHNGNLLVANSEALEVREYAPDSTLIRKKGLEGYTRGICIHDNVVYVGLSRSRNISDNGVESATVVALDYISLEEIGRVALPANEIYGIQLINSAEQNRLFMQIVDYASSRAKHEATIVKNQIVELNRNVATKASENDRLKQDLVQLERALHEREIELQEKSIKLHEKDIEINHANDQLVSIINSRSWRMTRPLRETRRWVTNPKGQAKRYARKALTVAKRVYFVLPLSPETQAMHRRFITKHMGWLLKAIRSSQQIPEIQPLPFPVTEPIDLTFQEELDLAKSITLNTSAAPLISVIIPIYGQCNYTLLCLASIAKHSPSIPYEIIVVDDYSPDHSREIIKHVANIKFIENAQNQGFIRSCNVGAKAATGEYVCFLNNDTQVAPGWLEELHRTFIEFPGTGLAGSKLVYPNGMLQEAGGILWQDGSAWNFGRNQDPRLPIYNYARETDYCSGASIMVPAQLFKELGGFDEHYLPAYCEDSDLALKIRSRGYRVIYQPLSVVVHFEGITSGTDTKQGVKAYQVENSKKLLDRWKKLLSAHQPPGVNVDQAKDRVATQRVLVLDHCMPAPNQDAGSVTSYNLMMLLREMNFQVTFIPEDNYLYDPEFTTNLQRVGIEVLYSPWINSVEEHLQEYGRRYDLVYMFRPVVLENNLPLVKKYCPQAKTIFHTVDLHFLRLSREAELENNKAKVQLAQKMKQRELAAIRSVDMSIVLSTKELTLLSEEDATLKLAVFPLILDIPGASTPWSARQDIAFIGGYQHTPNIDAVTYFSQEIMPLLRQKLPGVRFYIVGSKPPASVQALQTTDIIVTGFVQDLTSFLDNIRVSVAPLRYGAGIKGKIGTALAAGLPTVATTLAAEGMGLTNQENILIEDNAGSFSEAIKNVYEQEDLWNKLSKAGILLADNTWGAEAAWNNLAAILKEIGFAVTRSERPLRLYSEKSVLGPESSAGR